MTVIEENGRSVSPAARTPGRRWLRGLLSPAVLLLLPAGIVVSVFFGLPMLILVSTSVLTYSQQVGGTEPLTLANYLRFFSDPFYLNILLRTLRLAAIVTAICLAVGFPVAMQLSRSSGRTRVAITMIVLSPLLVSVVVRSFGWMLVLGPGGVLSALYGLFNPSEQLVLLYTETAIVIGLVHVMIPFMVLSLLGILQTIDRNMVLAAQNLGASPFRAFWLVTVPLSLPGIVAGSLIVFALSASYFVTPAVLGGARVKMMSYLVFQENISLLNWPFGAAIALILLALNLTAVAVSSRFQPKRETRRLAS
jgi:putative spermidine/putrescine transport system permease protein